MDIELRLTPVFHCVQSYFERQSKRSCLNRIIASWSLHIFGGRTIFTTKSDNAAIKSVPVWRVLRGVHSNFIWWHRFTDGTSISCRWAFQTRCKVPAWQKDYRYVTWSADFANFRLLHLSNLVLWCHYWWCHNRWILITFNIRIITWYLFFSMIQQWFNKVFKMAKWRRSWLHFPLKHTKGKLYDVPF